jgi:hypothetical protein
MRPVEHHHEVRHAVDDSPYIRRYEILRRDQGKAWIFVNDRVEMIGQTNLTIDDAIKTYHTELSYSIRQIEQRLTMLKKRLDETVPTEPRDTDYAK